MATKFHYPPPRHSGRNDVPMFVALIAVLAAVVFVFALDKVSGGMVRGYARQGGGALTAAVSNTLTGVTDSGVLRSHKSLEAENQQLKEEISKRDEEAARFQSLQEENDALREMARLAADEPGVTAPVLSSLDLSPYGTFLIGAGVQQGVADGDIVLTPGGFILGSVVSVSSRTSTVEAFFSAGKKIEMNVRGAAFEATGRGGGNAVGEVARAVPLAVGDTVIVPAFAGRPAGIVGKIDAASSSPATTIYIRPPINLDSLRYVYILSSQ